jgi:threonylcarbamoyladenosine tRNA methylthiotransferase MtaB
MRKEQGQCKSIGRLRAQRQKNQFRAGRVRSLEIHFLSVNTSSAQLKTYVIDVLGCKVNQYDAQQIARLLQRAGLRAAADGPADLAVVHTCGVTATAVQKSRQTLRRLRRRHPDAVVFLTGCAAGEALLTASGGIDARIAAGPGWIQRLADALQHASLPEPGFHRPDFSDDLPAENESGQTRAFLKIQDGCDANCAYCIVPQLRKPPRDKPLAAAAAEAEALVRGGVQEIVLTGVHVGLYGRGTETGLQDVLQRLIRIPDVRRLRLSSLHPAELTDDLLAVWASSSKVMPHLHLSLQSGSDGVLRRMGRGYTTDEYAAAVARAREALDRPAVTTDVIAGFPGETDAEFEETVAFCKRIGFAEMHIFSFSPRPGTRAVRMPGPVAGDVVRERKTRLAEQAGIMTAAFRKTFAGEVAEVLVEGCKNGVCSGLSGHYIPIRFRGPDCLLKTVVPVKITGVDGCSLCGEQQRAG